MDPVKLFDIMEPSIFTFALNLFFASVRIAPGGINPCSTSSPKGIFGSSLRLLMIDTIYFSSTLVFLRRSFVNLI